MPWAAANQDILEFRSCTCNIREIARETVPGLGAEFPDGTGIEPPPEREKKRTWKQFMTMHWESLYTCDFFTVDVLGISGTVRYMVFFVIEIKSRAVEITGIEVDPGGDWMKQVARNQTDAVDGFFRVATHLIHDRDPLFTEAFTAILRTGGVTCVQIPAQSPNCNPHAERFVKTRGRKRNERSEHASLTAREFLNYYHREAA